MNYLSNHPSFEVFAGTREPASYSDPAPQFYKGNPLIEALPPIMSRDEVTKALVNLPPNFDKDRKLPAHDRMHMVALTQQFFVPLSIHFDLEQRISRMIRSGYLARNPLAVDR